MLLIPQLAPGYLRTIVIRKVRLGQRANGWTDRENTPWPKQYRHADSGFDGFVHLCWSESPFADCPSGVLGKRRLALEDSNLLNISTVADVNVKQHRGSGHRH